MALDLTPAYLLWSLEFPCPLRAIIEDWQSPERTERQLRGAREFGRGVAEGRIVDGICISREAIAAAEINPDNAAGFRVLETLQVVGGEAIVREHCPGCVANIAEPGAAVTFAGCYGLVPIPTTFATRDSWYLQWVDSPLDAERTAAIRDELPSLAWPQAAADPEFQRLLSAVATAATHRLPMHAQMVPAGQVVNRRWILPPHCGRCGVEWNAGHQCVVCGGVGTQRSGLKRHIRGNRPYLPLAKIVGSEQAGELLRKSRMRDNQR